MKLKGISFFEQHVEKIVLGAVSVVFLGVVAMQFLYEPNTIKVGSAQAVPPGRAFEPVADKARVISSKLKAEADVLNLPAIPKIDLVQDFKRRHEGAVAPAATIVSLGKGVDVQGTVETQAIAVGGQHFATLSIAAPTTPVAYCYRNTFDPTEAHFSPDLAKLLPPEQPMDKASVTVQATFDGTALKAALLGAKGEGVPYPATWWRESMELLGVKVERQEQASDGQWLAAQDVAPAPGRGIPDLVKNVHGAADIADLAGAARGAADMLLRPTSRDRGFAVEAAGGSVEGR